MTEQTKTRSGRAKLHTLIAMVALLTMFWVFDYVQRPGSQWLGAVALGALGSLAVNQTIRAAVATIREDVRH